MKKNLATVSWALKIVHFYHYLLEEAEKMVRKEGQSEHYQTKNVNGKSPLRAYIIIAGWEDSLPEK